MTRKITKRCYCLTFLCMAKFCLSMLFLLFSVSLLAQETVSVKGKVVDSNGEPLIGVTVKEKGNSKIGTVTDFEGNYTLSVSNPNAVLEFSYVGFDRKSLPASQAKNVIMQVENNELNEVVVVGYGTQKKVNLTGAVATVDFGKEAQSRPVTTAAAALAGLSAGLQVLQTSGRPNSEGIGLHIRGVGTLNSSDPLVLVDGMEESLSDVNPNDIESISVLKDAASCAIYGNRGANGVILVTTKSGKPGQIRVSYSGKFSFDSPTRLVKFVSNYADYMEFMNESAESVGAASIYAQSTIDKWRAAEKNPKGIAASGYPNYVAYPNTDWYDEIYKTKLMQEHSISVLGNEGRTDYNITVTYLDNPGMIVNSGVKKYFLNARINSNITNWLQIGAHAWGFHTDQQRNDVNNLTEWSFLKAVPGIYPYYDGKYGGIEASEEDPAASNPLLNLNAPSDSYYKINHIYATTHAQVKFLKDFTARTVFGYDREDQRHKYANFGADQYSFSRNSIVANKSAYSADNVYLYQDQHYNWKWTNTLNWAHSFGKLHDVSALFGFEEGRYARGWLDLQKQGIIDPLITDMSTVTTMKYISGIDEQNRFRSWFGRVNYAFASKYLFEADFRSDGSSKFAPGHRWGFFPSVSAGWRISEEKFMKNSGFDNLKLRASVGQLGNNSVGNYAWQSTYDANFTVMDGGKANAYYQATLANARISWEKTTTYDIGLDFSLLNGRLSGVIDFYDRRTSGILYRPDIDLTLGNKRAPLQNLAKVDIMGLELTVTWRDHINDFQYGVSGNVTFNRNRVTHYKGKLDRGWVIDAHGNRVYKSNIGDVSTGGDTRILEGHKINEYYLRRTYSGDGSYFNADGSVNVAGGPKTGMIRTEADMKWLRAMINAGYTFLPNRAIAKDRIWYGDYIFADLNGDGVYGDSNDRDFMGCSRDPKINFGIQLYASWKGFDLSMNWTGATGFKTYWREIGQNASATVFGLQLPKDVAYNHYFYDPDNPNDPRTNLGSSTPRLSLNNGRSQSDAYSSNLYLYDCKFMKLRNLTFGYSLPAKIVNKIYAQNIRVYFSGENLLTITPFKGMDPEMRSGEGYAIMRQLAFGINVTF